MQIESSRLLHFLIEQAGTFNDHNNRIVSERMRRINAQSLLLLNTYMKLDRVINERCRRQGMKEL